MNILSVVLLFCSAGLGGRYDDTSRIHSPQAASQRLQSFFESKNEFEISYRLGYYFRNEAAWSLKSRNTGCFIRSSELWRWKTITCGLHSQGVFGVNREIRGYGEKKFLHVFSRANASSLPDVEKVQLGDFSDADVSVIEWKSPSVQLEKTNPRLSIERFEREIPLFSGRMDLHSTTTLSEIILNSSPQAWKQSERIFLGYSCLEWEFEHTLGSGTVCVCPELDFAPLEIVFRKSREQKFEEFDTLEAAGYKNAEMNCYYTSISDNFERFAYNSELVFDRGGLETGSRSEYDCVTQSVQIAPAQLEFETKIEDGTNVLVIDSPQLKAVWKNSGPVLEFDGEFVQELDSADMAPATVASWRSNIVTIAVVLIVIGVLFAFRMRKTQIESKDQ